MTHHVLFHSAASKVPKYWSCLSPKHQGEDIWEHSLESNHNRKVALTRNKLFWFKPLRFWCCFRLQSHLDHLNRFSLLVFLISLFLNFDLLLLICLEQREDSNMNLQCNFVGSAVYTFKEL